MELDPRLDLTHRHGLLRDRSSVHGHQRQAAVVRLAGLEPEVAAEGAAGGHGQVEAGQVALRGLGAGQLTVAEHLEKVPPHVAAGYRVAVADDQWLIYRSLSTKGNRTLLGHNLSTESLIARFDTTGEVDRLIEIE